MICYNCGCRLSDKNFCTSCGADVTLYKKIMFAANRCYNDGLEKATVRDLSGAINSLRQCIKLNKNHIEARNLLGLIYFERGEVVAALSEWVISKNIKSEKNIADDYINMIQNNPGRLDTFNQTIKKYNQALAYCQQDSLDLAIIQLKKVLSMNPKFLTAHQLLALLYINAQDWDKAQKELDKAIKIDTNNTTTLRYMKEVEQMKPSEEEKPKKKKEAVRYQNGNETVIQPVAKRDNAVLHTIFNIMIGLVVGIGIAIYMILPARIKASQDDATVQLKAVSEQLDAKTVQVDELTKQIESLNLEKDTLGNSLVNAESATSALKANTDLIEAAYMYINKTADDKTIVETMELIPLEYKEQNATETFQNLYDLILKDVGPKVAVAFYESGFEAYRTEDYNTAIADLSKAVQYDPENEEAIYNLANAYYKNGNTKQAVIYYQQVVDQFPNTDRARKAEKYIKEIQG